MITAWYPQHTARKACLVGSSFSGKNKGRQPCATAGIHMCRWHSLQHLGTLVRTPFAGGAPADARASPALALAVSAALRAPSLACGGWRFAQTHG